MSGSAPQTGLPIAWPDRDASGRFVARCSCGHWTVVGSAAEISDATRVHEDWPLRLHVVTAAWTAPEAS